MIKNNSTLGTLAVEKSDFIHSLTNRCPTCKKIIMENGESRYCPGCGWSTVR